MTRLASAAPPGGRITRNTLWNLLGSVLPVPAALACIPVLIAALGIERFGALAIAWMVMGYFGLFDLGLSLSTTKFAAAEIARGRGHALRGLLASSVLLHAGLGLIGGAALAALTPLLTGRVFVMPPDLTAEMRATLYWLAASVPAIVVTSALRGMLEGLQRFDIVNMIRIPAAILNYVGPVVALAFGTTLPLVVSVIVVARFVVLAAYGIACSKALPRGDGQGRPDRAVLVRLASFGGWLTASNLLNPLMVAADRFIIASAVSVAAVAFYVTPFEVITKAWILSASLLGALFPVLAAQAEREPGSVRSTCRVAEAHLLAITAPAIAVVLGFADLLLEGWLGSEFRSQSTPVAHLLAAGILVNIVAQVPLTALHSVGRADVTARIAVVELPLYALAAWYAASSHGITGVAAVWAARAAIEAAVMFTAAHGVLPPSVSDRREMLPIARRSAAIVLFLAGCWSTAVLWADAMAWRCTAFAVLFISLLVWEWRQLLRDEDREYLKNLWNRARSADSRPA
jgi:O-antigen/teichoic acid export membrane protein